jgi:hypothetical protein
MKITKICCIGKGYVEVLQWPLYAKMSAYTSYVVDLNEERIAAWK